MRKKDKLDKIFIGGCWILCFLILGLLVFISNHKGWVAGFKKCSEISETENLCKPKYSEGFLDGFEAGRNYETRKETATEGGDE